MSDASAGAPVEPEAAEASTKAVDAAPEEQVDVAIPPQAEAEDWVFLGGDVSLDLVQADVLAAELGATVVLLAGNREAGKTTLLVELYARFLDGPYNGLEFARSATIDAFDARHFAARVDSGNEEEDTDHTEDVDMRFLHLRLAGEDDRQKDLLLTDLKGELFSDLSEGATVGSRVPIAPRADKALLFVDGVDVGDTATRQVAVRDARLTLGALTEVGGMRPSAPLKIVLSKADLLAPGDIEWFADCAEGLVKFAKDRGVSDVSYTVLAARPRSDGPRTGLDEVTSWIWESTRAAPRVGPAAPRATGRTFVSGTIGPR